jgi:tryptophan synthase beta chain
MRDWVTNVETTHYLLGTVAGPHPFPTIGRNFHSIMGVEARQQILEKTGKLPTAVTACVGGGSNAIGLFHAFLDDESVALWGFEAAGDGMETMRHAATLSKGRVGVLHGAKSYMLQDEDGQTVESHSISAGLDYPGVGPEHSWLKDLNRAQYFGISDDEAMQGLKALSQTEGIIPAIETAHALAGVIKYGSTLPAGSTILLNLSGRGDKDMETVGKYFGFLD